MMEPLFLWISHAFMEDANLRWTKAQAIAWSVADLLVVLMALRIAGLARAQAGRKAIRLRHLLLWASAALVPLLPFVATVEDLFRLECAIVGAQFLVLLWTVFFDSRLMLHLLLSSLARPKRA